MLQISVAWGLKKLRLHIQLLLLGVYSLNRIFCSVHIKVGDVAEALCDTRVMYFLY
jgi:hypothetical protein